MTVRTLQVLINDELVGTLVDENGVWTFQYTEAWCNNPKGFPICQALPLNPVIQRDGATQRPIQWFFDNLLPEERLREVIGKEEGIHAADAFGLLERLGAESAGAVVLQPLDAVGVSKGVQTLSPQALSERIQALPITSLSSKAPKKMSLAGAQHKMVVNFEAKTGHLKEPLKGSPSTHILKPNSTAPDYPNSVANETFTMRLAARLGIKVPKVWRMYVPEPVFIIERYDRKPAESGQDPRRLHALDGCQVLSECAIYKYSSATFPKINALIHQCRNKAATRLAVFQWILFNTLVGNSDCHLKNISFLIDEEGMRVAPFYDLLCTAVYHTRAFSDEHAVWPNEPLAMPVARAVTFGEVTWPKLVETGMQLGLAKATAEREVNAMVGKLARATTELVDAMDADYADGGVMGHASDATKGAERHLLRAIRHVVIEDMLKRVTQSSP